jgi:dihydrofolate synthase / folylpolyglutamate synthase
VRLEELAGWLFGRRAGGVRWGLERTRSLLDVVGDPDRRFRSLLVGGTNGKGSVAALSASALRAAGRWRIGLYTSPHLVDFAERIQIDGVPIEAEPLLEAAALLRPAIERSEATFFEATTAIAFLCFARAGVDVAVVEVGLGGRLDATNVLLPDAVCVTNVALDHTEHLGPTLSHIAAEKGGIFKPGVPAITGAVEPGALAALERAAGERRAPLAHLDDVSTSLAVRTGVDGTTFRVASRFWGEREWSVPLVGAFQARNAMLAAELLALLPAEIRPGADAVRAGFAAVRWPGRMEIVRIRGTTWVFDVAHNAAGAAALADALGALDVPRPLVVVAGVLVDKDWAEMLPPLLSRADAAVLTVPPSAPEDRRWDPDVAAAALQPGVRAPVRAIADFERALGRATTLAPHGTVLVTGSIHTVGDAMATLGLQPFGPRRSGAGA